jgi:hypothetical protein
VLIQSALLVSFWFSDVEDVFQSWHWTGIAISLSQTLGLHRNPDHPDKNNSIGDQQRRLWRQIWWSCVLRDAWLSLGMGRPLRIDLDDCDCPRPTLEDTQAAFEQIRVQNSAISTPSDTKHASILWLALVELSVLLHEVIKSSHPNKAILSLENIKQLAARIDALQDGGVAPGSEASPVLSILVHHLRMHQQSVWQIYYQFLC